MEIKIENLNKKYGKVRALNDINLKIMPGIHGLLGPNGAGKTTLINILATISDYSGKITYDECDLKRKKLIKQNIGYLPQKFGMYKNLKVEEALKNVSLLKNIPHKMEAEEIESVLEKTDLIEFRKRKVGQLSGGMLQRLGIAQALLGSPQILLFDEPTVGLDPIERINFRKLLREYNDGKNIILISSHIVSDIESLCDTVSIFDQGNLLISDSIENIKNAFNNIVRENNISATEFSEFENSHTVINFIPTSDGIKVRYLVNQISNNSNTLATLEDCYTYVISGENNAFI